MTNFFFFFVISFRLLPSPYSSSSIFFRAALKVERNNSKIHEPQAKVELSGLKKREYMTFSRLISTACDLQGGCWSIHFEYIYFSLYRAKIMCSRHENTKSTFRRLLKCSSGAFCNNTKGSYNCTCKHGFTKIARKCIVKLNAGRDMYGREHIEKFFFWSPKCFCIDCNQSAHYCFLGSFILCWTDRCMATEAYLMFSTTNINAVQIKYEYHVMLLIF